MDSYAAWFTAFGNHTDPPPRKDGDEEVDVKMQKEWSFTKNLLGGDHSYVVRFSDKILRLNSKNKLKVRPRASRGRPAVCRVCRPNPVR